VRLLDENEVAPGYWYLEARFGLLEGLGHPTYANLGAVREGIRQRLAGGR
jgi:hypothetical protein